MSEIWRVTIGSSWWSLFLIFCFSCFIVSFLFTDTPSDPSFELAHMKSCLVSLQLRFYTNSMALNPDKSLAILFVTAQRA